MAPPSGRMREKLTRSAKRKNDAVTKNESTESQETSKRKTNADADADASLSPVSVRESEENLRSSFTSSGSSGSTRLKRTKKSESQNDSLFLCAQQTSKICEVNSDHYTTTSEFMKESDNSQLPASCRRKQSEIILTSKDQSSLPSASKYFKKDSLSAAVNPVGKKNRKLKIYDNDNNSVKNLTKNIKVAGSTHLMNGLNISQTSGVKAGTKIAKVVIDSGELDREKCFRGRITNSSKSDIPKRKETNISEHANKSLATLDDKEQSFSLPPLALQPSKTYVHTRNFPEIDFSDGGKSLHKSKPHIWPRCHDKSKNIFHYVSNLSLGRSTFDNKKAFVDSNIVSPIEDYQVAAAAQPFNCRITTIDWHPRRENFIAFGSKHGDLAFYKIGRQKWDWLTELKTLAGIGPGGYISALKFHPTDDEKFYTSALDGKVLLRDIETSCGRVEKLLLNTGCWERWFCSLDASRTEKMVVAGMSNGWVTMMDRNGQLVWEKRLHKQKVSHLEFSPCDPHLMCSASVDHTVKLWDTRMIEDNKALAVLQHEKGVNSAYFSLTDGTRLLTTDQNDEIRVYRTPYFHKETTIKHPHRFFQHITPIKAHWHPLSDNIVCGRFPSEQSNQEYGMNRTIDLFDAASGKMHFELKDMLYTGIVSLCKFNNPGNKILSAMGYKVCVWAPRLSAKDIELFSTHKDYLDSTSGLGIGHNRPASRRPETGDKKGKKGGDDIKKRKSAQSYKKDSSMETLVITSKSNQKKKDEKGKKK